MENAINVLFHSSYLVEESLNDFAKWSYLKVVPCISENTRHQLHKRVVCSRVPCTSI